MLTLNSCAGLRKAAVGLLAIVICFATGLRQAMAQSSVQLNFQLTTAAEAAVGAPVGYTITIANTGSAQLKLTGKVNLVAPNGTVYSIWTSTVNQIYSPG